MDIGNPYTWKDVLYIDRSPCWLSVAGEVWWGSGCGEAVCDLQPSGAWVPGQLLLSVHSWQGGRASAAPDNGKQTNGQKNRTSATHLYSYMKVNKANLRDLIAGTGLVISNWDSNHRFFSPCDLEIWWMTLKNNRAPLLYYIKLCA